MSDCIYGGRMEDEWDIRLLETFLTEICPDNVLENDAGFTFDKNGTFHLKRHFFLILYIGIAFLKVITDEYSFFIFFLLTNWFFIGTYFHRFFIYYSLFAIELQILFNSKFINLLIDHLKMKLKNFKNLT